MASKFTDENGKEAGELTVIAKYFRLPGQSLSEISAECKALTPENKTELALGAAKELGYTVVAS